MASVLALGGSGRLGGMVRRHWPDWLPSGAGAGASAKGGVKGGAVPEVFWPDRATLDPLTMSPDALREAIAPHDVVLALAGTAPNRGQVVDFNDHVRLGDALAQAARAAGKPLLIASSAAVYENRARGGGNGGGNPEDGETPGSGALLRETMALGRGGSAHGRGKRAMEARLRRSGAAVTCLRIGNVAGADAILGNWHPGFTLDQLPDGTSPVRSYIGPLTLARVMAVLCARAAGLPGNRAGNRTGKGAGESGLPARLSASLPARLNVAAPGTVEMAALLRTAGLPFHWSPAGTATIARVAFDTARLARIAPLLPEAGQAAQLVAEWHADRAALREASKTVST